MASEKEVAKQILDLNNMSPEALTELEQEGAAGLDTAPIEATDMVPPTGMPFGTEQQPVAPPTPQPNLATQAGQLVGDWVIKPTVDRYAAYADLAKKGLSAAGDFTKGAVNAVAPGAIPTETAAPEAMAPVATKVAAQAEPVVAPQLPEPTAEQRAASHEEIIKPAMQAISDHDATVDASNLLQSKMAQEQDKLQKQQDAIQAQIDQTDNSVRFRSLPEIMKNGSFGDKVMASIALLMGGVAQGLGGDKTNPVMDFIDRQVQQQGEKDKLSLEHKLSLKKQLTEIVQLKVQNLANKSSDIYHQGMYKVEVGKLAVELQKVEGDQKLKAEENLRKTQGRAALADAYNGKPVTPEMQTQMNETETKSLVNVGGKTYKALNPDAASKFTTIASANNQALITMKKYQTLIEKGLWKTLGEKGAMAAYNDAKVADTMKQAIVGALRLPYTGPGALNQGEREGLIKNIGDYGLFNLPEVEANKLKFIFKDLEARTQQAALDFIGPDAKVIGKDYFRMPDGRLLEQEDYAEAKARETGTTPEIVQRAIQKLKAQKQ